MSAKTKATSNKELSGAAWALILVPLLLLGIILALIVVTGGGLTTLSGPPIEQIKIERVLLPEAGMIEVLVVNDGPQAVTIPQVLVDDAYWPFTAEPSTTIPRLGSATFMIPYPWVKEETHAIRLITGLGATFDAEIPVAVRSPQPSLDLFLRFGLVGFYVGIVPVLLGMLWYPVMRRLSRQAMTFILSLTVGLLIFLAVGTWLDAVEFAAELPAFWQGVPLVLFVTVIALGTLLALGTGSRRMARTPIHISYLIALGIGLHNLGEGLAIGAAFALGAAALGTFLVLGFTLHNITEGVAIAAPIVGETPPLKHFAFLILLAGGPAVLGMWIGGFAFNPVLATIFLAIGIGAILQVIFEVGKMIVTESRSEDRSPVNWVTLGGVGAGIAIMYFTAFLVKF